MLFIALLTLFGLHPSKFLISQTVFVYSDLDVNPSRRYYGIISQLSILNTTKYIYGLDKLCNQSGAAILCLNITTSTSIVSVSTTIITNRTIITMNYSYVLLCSCLMVYCIYRKTSFYSKTI
jgi:hypothetical protein